MWHGGKVGILVALALGMALATAGDVTGTEVGSNAADTKPKASVTHAPFGKLADGTEIEQYTLTNTTGATAKIITFGAILTSVEVPDKSGKSGEVTLGFDTLAPYEKGHPFFGAIAGRVANRIAKGKFTLEGKTYTLATNNGPNHLHGGLKGFDKQVWKAKAISANGRDDGAGVALSYTSKDGEEGYPGTLHVTVTYTLLKDRNVLRIEYTAHTDKATPINLSNHTYWNLAGKGDVLNHVLTLHANRYTPVDATLIPTGEVADVQGTPFDFMTSHPIGERIAQTGGDPAGYDHNFVRDGYVDNKTIGLMARVYEPTTGRILTMETTEPAVQFYTGNFLDGTLTGHNGNVYNKNAGFCLEAQHYPDAVNHPKFPSVILRPGQTYHQRTEYAFTVNQKP